MKLNFKQNLRHLMSKDGITQEKMAEIAGVSRQAVSQWINQGKTPSLESILLIAKYFNISVEQLVYDERIYKENKVEGFEDFKFVGFAIIFGDRL